MPATAPQWLQVMRGGVGGGWVESQSSRMRVVPAPLGSVTMGHCRSMADVSVRARPTSLSAAHQLNWACATGSEAIALRDERPATMAKSSSPASIRRSRTSPMSTCGSGMR
jgi:hypothetical protein